MNNEQLNKQLEGAFVSLYGLETGDFYISKYSSWMRGNISKIKNRNTETKTVLIAISPTLLEAQNACVQLAKSLVNIINYAEDF